MPAIRGLIKILQDFKNSFMVDDLLWMENLNVVSSCDMILGKPTLYNQGDWEITL